MFFSYLLLVLATFTILNKQIFVTSYAVPEKVYYDLKLSRSLFDQFVSEHQKQYTEEEAKHRFQVFQDNLEKINQLNQDHENAVFGFTTFSDLTTEEFMEIASCIHNTTDAATIPAPAYATDIQAPPSLDYRQQNLVTGVKNQGQCGSCFIFGMMADIEGQNAKTHQQNVPLSEQYPLDCGPFTCNGGFPNEVANWLAKTPGAISMQDYPYLGSKSSCRSSGQVVARVAGAQRLAGGGTESVKNTLAQHGPLATVLMASPELQHYTGGTISPRDCAGQINHAVALVGYGANYWIIKNSWGTQWGEQGYVNLAFEHCSLGEEVFPSQVN